MSVSRLSPLCLVLVVLASPVLGGFPFVPYPEYRATAPSFSPHLIYGSGISGGNDELAGFSYFTKDFGGGESEVLFFMGPNSDTKMNAEAASLKDQLSSWPFISTPGIKLDKKDDKDVKSEPTEIKDASATTAPLVSAETEKPSSSKDAESKKEDKKVADDFQGLLNQQYLPQKSAGFETPYPIFRLSGSAAYYPQVQSTQFSHYPEFPADYFRSQYLPIYNQYNSFQNAYVPSYPSLDTDYYNPAVFPTVHQTPIIVPSLVTGNSVGDKTESVVTLIDRRFKPDVEGKKEEKETSTVSSSQESDSDKKTEENSPSSEKGSEVPTSTEQIVEKSTTDSETAPTTTQEIKELEEIKETTTTTA